MAETRKHARAPTGGERRERILEAARQVFAEEGLDGASLRAIALRAGYTPAALYFYFESKEDMYAEVLRGSLASLGEAVAQAVSRSGDARDRLRAAAMAFFRFYAERPRDLDLGFYLLRGGMKPAGLGRDRDMALNAALEAALCAIAEAAVALGAPPERANLLMVDCFAHAAGLLLLLHTGRIRMFGASAAELMVAHVDDRIRQLEDSARNADD
jgi:AcrR family transcriptional regulator